MKLHFRNVSGILLKEFGSMKAIRVSMIMVFLLAAFMVASADQPQGNVNMPTVGLVERTATILSLKGAAETKSSKTDWKPVQEGMVLKEGDIVRTKVGSHMVLGLDGAEESALIDVMENSQVTISTLQKNREEDYETTLLNLAIGKILVKAKKIHSQKSKFEVQTPASLIGIRGTAFSVSVREMEL